MGLAMLRLTLKRTIPWIRLVLASAIVGFSVWYVAHEITIGQVRAALATAKIGIVLLALFVIVMTTFAKSWRWQLLYPPRDQSPPFAPLFWALAAGQFVNLVTPFVRLGEIVRVQSLDQRFQVGKARSLGTIVVEKTLDLVVLIAIIGALIPANLLPGNVANRTVTLGLTAGFIISILYLLVFRRQLVSRYLLTFVQILPSRTRVSLIHLIESVLDGLSILRDRRRLLLLLAMSAFVASLSVLAPLLLFSAMEIPFGLLEATLLHIAVSVASAPATVPAKIGVFELTAFLSLNQLGIENDAVALGYALIFHVVILLPQLALGGLAILNSSWYWHFRQPKQAASESNHNQS
jgi:uncharacterized protein (TIRG00374 family)